MHETLEKSRGRLERRRLTSTTVLNDYLDWPDVGQVCRLVRETTRAGEETTDVQYALTSVGRDRADARRLLKWWRGQWKIENGLHWVRDVTLCEDASRIRTGDAPSVSTPSTSPVFRLMRPKLSTPVGQDWTQAEHRTH